MKTKKIIALGLTAAMAFTLAGCGSAFKSTSNKIAKALDDADYEKIEEDDYDEDDMEDYAKDGFYVTLTDEDNIEDLADSFDFDEDDVKSVFAACKMDKDGVLMAMVYEFSDKDAAQDFYDDMVDEAEDEVDDAEEWDAEVETNEDDDFFQYASVMDDKDWDIYLATYEDVRINGTTVSVITVMAESKKADILDEMDSICEALKIDSLSELI